MKKILVALMVLLLVAVPLIGCGSSEMPAVTTTPTPSATEQAEIMSLATTEPVIEQIEELVIGETAATDIVEWTLDSASLTVALSNSWGDGFFLPKEYDAEKDIKNPFVAPKGHTLVAFTFTVNNVDRGGTISVERDGRISDGRSNYIIDKAFITIVYDGEEYMPTPAKNAKFGYSIDSDGKSKDLVNMTNVLISRNESITIRAYLDISVEIENLKSPFDIMVALPTSSGETTDFIYSAN